MTTTPTADYWYLVEEIVPALVAAHPDDERIWSDAFDRITQEYPFSISYLWSVICREYDRRMNPESADEY